MNASPDTVVILAVAALSGRVSSRARDICSTIDSSTSRFDNRTCAILDALASLCVYEPYSEVIAIGCHYLKPNTELIIASNNGPPLI